MYNELKRFEQILFDICAVGLLLFYSYAAVLSPAATQYHRGIYVIVTYVLVFLLYKSKSTIGRIIDYLLITASIVTIGYWMYNFEAINYRTGAETPLDIGIAMVGVLLGIELARRVVGTIFVVIGVVMLAYGVYGDYMPDLVSHAGDTFPYLCTSIFYKSDGIFGIMANVLATYILLALPTNLWVICPPPICFLSTPPLFVRGVDRKQIGSLQPKKFYKNVHSVRSMIKFIDPNQDPKKGGLNAHKDFAKLHDKIQEFCFSRPSVMP